MKRLIAAAAAALCISATAASAQSFTFSFSGTTWGEQTGTFTIAGTPDANGYYVINALTGQNRAVGSVSATALSLLAPNTFPPDNPYANDNLYNPTTNLFGVGGVGFTDGTTRWDVFNAPGSGTTTECGGTSVYCGNFQNTRVFVVQDPATPGVPAVPEPATWSLLLLGFGLSGMVIRRRSKKAGPRLVFG